MKAAKKRMISKERRRRPFACRIRARQRGVGWAFGPNVGNDAEEQFRKRRKTITDQFRAGDDFNDPMAGNKRGCRIVFSFDSGGYLHTSITFMRPYAVRMYFFAEIEKPMKSRAESACREPYALYAPLLGVGVFSAFFLLRELHTVHTTAYG